MIDKGRLDIGKELEIMRQLALALSALRSIGSHMGVTLVW